MCSPVFDQQSKNVAALAEPQILPHVFGFKLEYHGAQVQAVAKSHALVFDIGRIQFVGFSFAHLHRDASVKIEAETRALRECSDGAVLLPLCCQTPFAAPSPAPAVLCRHPHPLAFAFLLSDFSLLQTAPTLLQSQTRRSTKSRQSGANAKPPRVDRRQNVFPSELPRRRSDFGEIKKQQHTALAPRFKNAQCKISPRNSALNLILCNERPRKKSGK
jgi:hypothetical protein